MNALDNFGERKESKNDHPLIHIEQIIPAQNTEDTDLPLHHSFPILVIFSIIVAISNKLQYELSLLLGMIWSSRLNSIRRDCSYCYYMFSHLLCNCITKQQIESFQTKRDTLIVVNKYWNITSSPSLEYIGIEKIYKAFTINEKIDFAWRRDKRLFFNFRRGIWTYIFLYPQVI